MGYIKHNDELLRINDDGFDVVFNCDNKHKDGVSYHAEKNGKKTKIDPEYAAASLVKKVGQGGWPSDLPKPSEGGYGYTTTEVTDVAELICKRGEGDMVWSEDVEFPDQLIVGESYEVTVNGVTGTYECFECMGDPVLGAPYAILDQGEPGKWSIGTFANDEGDYICAGMNLRRGETATIIISSIEFVLENDREEVDRITSDDVQFTNLIVGESYEVTINGVTRTYECFNQLGRPILEAAELDDFYWSIKNIMSQDEDGHDIVCIHASSLLRNGETVTFVVKHVINEDHRIDKKYLPYPRMFYMDDFYDEETDEEYYVVKEFGTNKILTNNDIENFAIWPPSLLMVHNSFISFEPFYVMNTFTQCDRDVYDPDSKRNLGKLEYSEIRVQSYDEEDQDVLNEYAKLIVNTYSTWLTEDFSE